ncbi:hypothetical protein GCM10011494_27190 [Novosphingobium endophyticum]|uniref:Uncharacterized protein n=1 Tax=Novosphingobium endophyticum TaxID=1955250 RepID=A0A916TUB8_9SPHN|nr:hypothetical protein [Novosphingobium endophyticum]GGC07084.1 hypothetical protein GCM10011494_27190 [Novosphingobium endophyticum]
MSRDAALAQISAAKGSLDRAVVTQGCWGVEGDEPTRLMLIHNFKLNKKGAIFHVRIGYDEGCLHS